MHFVESGIPFSSLRLQKHDTFSSAPHRASPSRIVPPVPTQTIIDISLPPPDDEEPEDTQHCGIFGKRSAHCIVCISLMYHLVPSVADVPKSAHAGVPKNAGLHSDVSSNPGEYNKLESVQFFINDW